MSYSVFRLNNKIGQMSSVSFSCTFFPTILSYIRATEIFPLVSSKLWTMCSWLVCNPKVCWLQLGCQYLLTCQILTYYLLHRCKINMTQSLGLSPESEGNDSNSNICNTALSKWLILFELYTVMWLALSVQCIQESWENLSTPKFL